jgi:hypothetical protein
MSEKLKALISTVFVHLNRYERSQPDFSGETLIRDCELYFSELDRLDLSGEVGMVIDEHLKLRVNTVPRNAQTLSMVVANVLALYFWYVRRPPQQCQNAFLAAKKLRGAADDSQFIEQTLLPFVLNEKIKALGKAEKTVRTMLLHRAGQIAANFRPTDQVPVSSTQIVRSDSWQKKMLRIAYLNVQGRKAEIRSLAPEDELKVIASHNDFARCYLRENGIYKGKNPLLVFIGRFFGSIGSGIASIINFRFVIHIFRDRWPVYLVYLILVLAFFFLATDMRHFWEGQHSAKVKQLEQLDSSNEVRK